MRVGNSLATNQTVLNTLESPHSLSFSPSPSLSLSLLQVRVGQNLRYEVGTVRYVSSSTPGSESKLAIIIGASAAGGVILVSLVVIFFIIVCFTRRARAKEKQFSNLLVQMEQWEVEMADECKRGQYRLLRVLWCWLDVSHYWLLCGES